MDETTCRHHRYSSIATPHRRPADNLLPAWSRRLASPPVHGNVPEPIGARNTCRVFEVAGMGIVPVRVGAQAPTLSR